MKFSKNLNKILLIFLLIGFIGCRSKAPVIPVPVKTFEKQVTKLVPVYMPTDSALLTAYLECDSANKVILRNLDAKKTKGMQTDFSFKDGRLDLKSKAGGDSVMVKHDITVMEKEIPIPVPVETIKYKMNAWQRVFYYIGLFGSIIGAVYVTIKLKFL